MQQDIKDSLKNMESIRTTGVTANSLARQFILENQPDYDALKKLYGNGVSPENMHFSYQFACACGDFATDFIIKENNPNEKLEEGIKRFSNAVLQLNDAEFAFALEHIKVKLTSYVPEFSGGNKQVPKFIPEIAKKISHTINHHADMTPSKRVALTQIINSFDSSNQNNKKDTPTLK